MSPFPQSEEHKTIDIRPYTDADYRAVKAIYQDAIRELACRHYTAEQVDVWAGRAEIEGFFAEWLSQSRVFVAVDAQDVPLGFAGLEPPARIASLFVTPRHARQGIGLALVEYLLALEPVQPSYTTEASELSRGVFERCGFRVVEVEHVTLDGVAMSRYAMRKN